MKIAVLASREDAHVLVPILRVFKEIGISAYGLSITPDWVDMDQGKIRLYMGEASHFLLVADGRSLLSSWFGFAAGIASAKRNGISLLRVDPAWEPPRFLRGFPIFEDLQELRAFFSVQREEWMVEEARQAAKIALLELGISFHADSLSTCIQEGDLRSVKLFLDAGFNPDSRDRHGVPLLCIAARHSHRSVAEALLERGADINLQSEDRGYSALMDATLAGAGDLVDFFLERGADPDLASKDGQTALVIAVGRKDLVVSRHLVEHGADPDLKDKLGLSARGYARLFKHSELIGLFERAPSLRTPSD